MAFLPEPEFWSRLPMIIVIDLMLAGDNALVIALAVRSLPERQQLWVFLRLALIALATVLLKVPLLLMAGGGLLIWIAVKLVRQPVDAELGVRRGTSLWDAIWVIVVADAVMSLDNVIGVAGAAHGDLRLIVIGIGLSLPLVVWGSGILTRLMNRFTWIIWLGGGVLGLVAGEMILEDQILAGRLGSAAPVLEAILPATLGVVILGLGWRFGRARRVEIPERT